MLLPTYFMTTHQMAIDTQTFLLSCKLLAVTRETKLTLSIALNPESTRMWANAQPDGRPAEHRWRPLFNAPKFG